jgi:two-component system CheB/CheR fusion protein
MPQEGEAGQPDQRQLVIVGSSAGGIDALSTLVATLPTDFPAPIVIAQHLDPHRPSTLPAILARRSALPVRVVEDQAPLEAGVVFVVPANRHVLITDGTIDLHVNGEGGPTPSINLLLKTAAAQYGEGLIAVILTGMGSDGAAGAHSVKEAGGTVIIQNPDTAAHPSMPRSLAPNTVDIVANLDRIGPIVADLLRGIEVPSPLENDRALAPFLARIREQHGIDFSSYKQPTIRRRLQRRMVATGTHNIESYLAYLEAHPDEYRQLVSTFLIKVTEFFRDPELYDSLRTTILPELIAQARRRDRELRIWSAGCATGEEAYSLAILVAEVLGHELGDWNIRIFSTDLDAEAINFARQGVYSAAAVEGLPDEILARYFTREDDVYQIRKHVRALTVFGQHDLGQRAPFPRIDLVVCRNVLIYFTQELQRRALQLFAYSLRDRGLLVLGKAESINPLSEFFALQQPQLKIYRRHGERILMPATHLPFPTLPANTPRLLGGARLTPGGATARPSRSQEGIVAHDERYLLRLPVGMVIVDRRYDIQAINAVARRLLGIFSAAIGDDLIHIAQHVPQRLLRDAIDRTFRTGMPVSLEPFSLAEAPTDTPRSYQITCYPQRSDDGRGALEAVLIVVNDLSGAARAGQTDDLSDAMETEGSPEERLQRQKRQIDRLTETNRQLLEANQDLLSANEELRTANEEFIFSVEEAQASAEEIETLNEEMQATNEELETLNEELQATVEELNTTNDELHARTVELQDIAQTSEEARARLAAILDTMGDALLVLNRDGSPLLSNRSYERLFGKPGSLLMAEDAEGRPLARHQIPQNRALEGEPFSMEFRISNPDGMAQWFEADSRPILDLEGQLQWAILVIRDITARSLHRLQEQFLGAASHELRTPLTSLRGYLQILSRQVDAGEITTERARRYMVNALSQVDRLTRLISDLADVVRLQNDKYTLERHPLDLAALIEQSVETAQAQTAQPIRLMITDTPLRVQGDAGRLEQVILNLLTNAITHAPDSPEIVVTARRVGGQAELRVQDFGPGIPRAALPLIFSRFGQAGSSDNGRKRGLGLGLFIARELVLAHGGTLDVDSIEGQGSTFIVRLQLLPEEPGSH